MPFFFDDLAALATFTTFVAFAALHGSWNRTRKSGYRVVLVEIASDGATTESDFAVGWEIDEEVIGRPVDVAEGPDGALYVSDDYAGVVYRVAFGERAAGARPVAARTGVARMRSIASAGAPR